MNKWQISDEAIAEIEAHAKERKKEYEGKRNSEQLRDELKVVALELMRAATELDMACVNFTKAFNETYALAIEQERKDDKTT